MKRVNFSKLATLISLMSFCFLWAGQASPHNVRLYRLQGADGTPYTAAWIGAENGEEVQERFAGKLIQIAKDWKERIYEKIYPEHIDRIRQTDDPFGPRNQMVIIFKGNDAYDVQGTFRIESDLPSFWSSENAPVPLEQSAQLTLEKHLNLSLKRPEYTVGPIPYFLPGKPDTQWTKFPSVHGGLMELKAFVKDPNAADDLVPSLLFLLEAGESVEGFPKSPMLLRAKYPPEIARQMGRESGEVVPAKYVLICEQGMVPYYSGLGFRPVPGMSADSNAVAMETSREGFVKIWTERFAKRPGASLVRSLTTSSAGEWRRASWVNYAGTFLTGPKAPDTLAWQTPWLDRQTRLILTPEEILRSAAHHFGKPGARELLEKELGADVASHRVLAAFGLLENQVENGEARAIMDLALAGKGSYSPPQIQSLVNELRHEAALTRHYAPETCSQLMQLLE